MDELEKTLNELEWHLDAARCFAALPRMLELSDGDNEARTKVLLLAARASSLENDDVKYASWLAQARDAAEAGSLESKVRVCLLESSTHSINSRVAESVAALEFAIEHLSELPADLRSSVQAIRAGNEVDAGRYAEAIEFAQEAIELGTEYAASVFRANGIIAFIFRVLERIEESEQYSLEQIRFLVARGWSERAAGVYSMLASALTSIGAIERATEYEHKSLELLAGTLSHSQEAVMSRIWKAHLALERHNLDDAILIAEEALAIAEQESYSELGLIARIALGRAHFERGEISRSVEPLEVVRSHADELAEHHKMNLLRYLAQAYRAVDRTSDAFDVSWLLLDLQSEFDARKREALLNYHRALEQKIHDQKTSILTMKASLMESELAQTAAQLIAQAELLGRFRNDMREIVRESRSDDPVIKKVRDKLKTLPCEQIDWAKFDSQFSTVHPDFKSKLDEKHPELTRSEVKICSLTRLKLTGEEIAHLLCLSPRSVETHRFNIRKKFGLKTEQNLGAYLASL